MTLAFRLRGAGVYGVADTYAANGFSPDVVADFAGEYYRTGGSATDFDTMFGTPTRSSLATMYNSSGELVYCPHNYIENTDLDTATVGHLDGLGAWPTNWTDYTSGDGEIVAVGTEDGVPYLDLKFIEAEAVTVNAMVYATTMSSGLKVGDDFRQSAVMRLVDSTNITSVDIELRSSAHTTDDSEQRLTTSDKLIYAEFQDVTSTSWGQWRMATTVVGTSGWTFTVRIKAPATHLVPMADNRLYSGTLYNTFVDNEAASAAIYLPRRGSYTYNGSSWVNSGIGIETEARTNLETYSNDPTQNWAEGANTATMAQDATDPWGNTNTAWTLKDNSATGTGTVEATQAVTVSTSTDYTFSTYAKASGLGFLIVSLTGFTTPADDQTTFNLSTGAVGNTGTNHTATIEDVGGGWYRCAVTFTTDGADTTGTLAMRVGDADDDNTVDLDGTSSILIYGQGFEAGDSVSSYIPTDGATVTRTADDNLIIDDTKLGIDAVSQDLTVQMEGQITYADNNQSNGSNGAGGEVTFWSIDKNGADWLLGTIETGGADVGTLTIAQEDGGAIDESGLTDEYAPGVNVAFNVAGVYGSRVQVAADGSAGTENTTSVELPDITAYDLYLFDRYDKNYNGYCGLTRLWNDDIGDTGLEEAT